MIVIGGGPKGVALWTKHAAMKKAGINISDITVVERRNIGSHWLGDDGYSDGFQLLITPSEQDLGYPYALNHQDRSIAKLVREQMFRISWMQYLIARNRYPQWVLAERPRSTHQELVDYLQWAAEQARMVVSHAEIKTINIEDNQWTLAGESSNGQLSFRGDGIVITGPGKPRKIENQPDGDSRLFDGRSFWKNLEEFDGLKKKRVAVIGAGETAGAIACAILDRVEDPDTCSIDLVCKQNAYFSRAQAQQDLRYFSDPTNWDKLSVSRRNSIVRRADRGVVSVNIKNRLENCNIVSYMHAEVEKIESKNSGLCLHLKYEDGPQEELPYDLVVVATGFDPLSFLEWFETEARCFLLKHVFERMPLATQESITAQLGKRSIDSDFYTSLDGQRGGRKISKAIETGITNLIAQDLSLDGFAPKIHLPMMAAFSQGPGFPNLNCLGLLSDRILKAYIQN